MHECMKIVTEVIHAPQTKILEDRTKDRSCLRTREALFKGVSTGFGLLLVEKCFEKTLQRVCSTVQNLRLGSINFFVTLLQGWAYKTQQTCTMIVCCFL